MLTKLNLKRYKLLCRKIKSSYPHNIRAKGGVGGD
jgi:hypothetical protein